MEGKFIPKSFENRLKLDYISNFHLCVNCLQRLYLIHIIHRIQQRQIRILLRAIRRVHLYKHNRLIPKVLHLHEYPLPVHHLIMIVKIVQSLGSHRVIKVDSSSAVMGKVPPFEFSRINY